MRIRNLENLLSHENIVSLFTERGALLLEKVVIKSLYQRLNMTYQERSDFEFERYVNQARRIYEDMTCLNEPLEARKRLLLSGADPKTNRASLTRREPFQSTRRRYFSA